MVFQFLFCLDFVHIFPCCDHGTVTTIRHTISKSFEMRTKCENFLDLLGENLNEFTDFPGFDWIFQYLLGFNGFQVFLFILFILFIVVMMTPSQQCVTTFINSCAEMRIKI